MAKIGRTFANAFNQTFLRTTAVREFSSFNALEKFLSLNLEMALFYGNLYVRRNGFELVSAVEYLVYERLCQYEKSFREKGRRDLENCVKRFRHDWIEHIESPDGFTRQAAWHYVYLNTDYANARRSGTGLSWEQAMRQAKVVANGLVNCGYTPKWLKDFDAVDAPSSP